VQNFPYELRKAILKDAKTLQIKSLYGFFVGVKTPFYAPKPKRHYLMQLLKEHNVKVKACIGKGLKRIH
jgi:hypothetical protein